MKAKDKIFEDNTCTVNVMDYFQDAPEPIIVKEQSFAQKIKELLICNQTAKK